MWHAGYVHDRVSEQGKPRVIVVGAGSSGCVLAARLAGCFDVVLVEAGGRGSQAAASTSTWSLPAQLTATRQWRAIAGRAVGGSSVVNGGYFAAPADRDLERWYAAGGEAWRPERARAHIAAAAERLGVNPSPQTHPVSGAFIDACELAGLGSGLRALGTTIHDGVARNVADAFLVDPAITVREDSRVLRVVIEDARAVGVEVADADGATETLRADEVVLCAGGFGTARLLLASGFGAAAALDQAGIDSIVDLPGVGAAFSDHPTVWVEWVPTRALSARPLLPESAHGAFPLALLLGSDGGAGDDLELLVCTQPPDPDEPGPLAPFGLIVGLQRPHSRGTVDPSSPHPLAPARIAYRYLDDPRDRSALRVGVRTAAALLSSAAFAGMVDRLVDLDDETLADDGRLDAWIEQRLASAAHTCGTAAMGPTSDPLAVVDGAGRVRGVRGLRIADTSLLPVVPGRAPAAAAMAVGAIIADQMCE